MQGFMDARAAEYILARETGKDGILEQLGISGLIVAHRFRAHVPILLARGWRVAGVTADATILEKESSPYSPVYSAGTAVVAAAPRDLLVALARRPRGAPGLGFVGSERAASPQVREFAEARVVLTKNELLKSVAEIDVPEGAKTALIIARRAWYPGFRATLNGTALAVLQADLVMPAVELPAGSHGTLEISYWPRGLVMGGVLASVAGALFIVFFLVLYRFVPTTMA
jgi:hypothetical protein